MEISIKEINELRKLTGSGIMNCKKALLETNGDLDKAIDLLRKTGIKVAKKRTDYLTTEGRVVGGVNKNCDFGVIIVISSETDFVANSDVVKDFSNKVVNIAIEKKIENIEDLNVQKYYENISVYDKLIELIGVLGEKLDLKYTFLSGERVEIYNHFNNKLSVLLEVKNYKVKHSDILKNIAMQIAAMNPLAINRENIGIDIIEKEMDIAREQSKNAKNVDIAEKMAKGKLEKFFKENVLLEQSFIMDEKISVLNYIKQNGDFELVNFKRVEITK